VKEILQMLHDLHSCKKQTPLPSTLASAISFVVSAVLLMNSHGEPPRTAQRVQLFHQLDDIIVFVVHRHSSPVNDGLGFGPTSLSGPGALLPFILVVASIGEAWLVHQCQ
jgi:hypothetical protein